MTDIGSRGASGTPCAAARTASEASFPTMFLLVPAERYRPRPGVGRKSRPGLVDPVLDAVVPLLDPLPEEPPPLRRVHVKDRRVDARAGGGARFAARPHLPAPAVPRAGPL